MTQQLSEYLAGTITQSLSDSESRRRIDQLMGLLETLCGRERIDETEILKSVVLLVTAECLGLDAASLLSEVPPEIPTEEVEKSRLLHLAHSHGHSDPSRRRALGILSDLFLLEQMGTTKLGRVFQAWNGDDTVELYQKVKESTDHALTLAQDLQTSSARELAFDRLRAMKEYCAKLEEDMKLVLDHRRGSTQRSQQ